MQEEKTSEKYSKVSHHLTTVLYKSAEPPLISLLFARKMRSAIIYWNMCKQMWIFGMSTTYPLT